MISIPFISIKYDYTREREEKQNGKVIRKDDNNQNQACNRESVMARTRQDPARYLHKQAETSKQEGLSERNCIMSRVIRTTRLEARIISIIVSCPTVGNQLSISGRDLDVMGKTPFVFHCHWCGRAHKAVMPKKEQSCQE